jgi:hypothetical protein
MCNCHNLSECEEALPTRESFISGFETLASSSELWAELFVCKSCAQHWIVEEGAEMDRRSNKAFKINAKENWLSHDTRPALAQWLIARHGGLSESNCAYRGCGKKALKNMAVCVYHGHSEYRWQSAT